MSRLIVSLASVALLVACHQGARVSWPRPAGNVPAVHAEVRTVNAGYRRDGSRVLVREIDRPTRALLDWAAYHANFMTADPPPEEAPPAGKPDVSRPFGGLLETATLTSTITRTPLTAQERAYPVAFAPLVEYLSARKLGAGLEELGAAVRAETWGLGGSTAIPRQAVVALYGHSQDPSQHPEIWVKVEFAPWWKALGPLPDEDGDGFPELYGRVRSDLFTGADHQGLRGEYANRVLTEAEVKAWANQLSSYWYPSYNTDLVTAASEWPDAETEPAVRQELNGARWKKPTIVLRGKPQGQPTYNVFLVSMKATPGMVTARTTGPALPRSTPTPNPQPVVDRVARELAANGGTWAGWAERLAPFHASVRARLKTAPPAIKGFAGSDGFLFYRNEMSAVTGGDLLAQRRGKNPLPVIVEFAQQLRARGVDFLFVPVPSKIEIFPDRFDPKHASLTGRVVNPFGRKFLHDLGTAGVEVIDLLPDLLAERAKDAGEREPLFQAQDTHWTHRGLSLAARLVAERVKQYPWAARLPPGRPYGTREKAFTRLGDVHKNLPEPQKRRYRPETLVGQQVLNPEGAPYEDDPESPIVVLGDSFTGVYQLTDCEHAGVSAHLARALGRPVDLVMSYGGGPNVRQKLLRRGMAALETKRLVIWMMTARDLYDYWEDWQSLELPTK